MAIKTSIVMVFMVWLAGVHCHTYYLGSCPRVDPVNDFDMSKFLGRWYVIQKFSTASSCWTYDFVRNKTDDSLKIVQSRDHVALDTVGLDNNYRYTGTLDVPDLNRPGFMRVRFPMSLAGKADYVVFSTDYDNYAAIYSCQSILFGHRRSASILSRRPTLDQPYINKIRTKLDSFGVDPHDFSIIDHTDCKTLPSTSLLNVEVNQNTFSTGNVINVAKDVGKTVVNGVVDVAQGVGTIVNRLANSTTTNNAVAPAGNANRDVEFVTVGNRPNESAFLRRIEENF
ncbi:hypothetical protein OUZ56_007847 [Daphnia magna]|uniref:Lipocalin/cytosolic fatty-acid binding domain-containing protein n=1 Tax=Daphnia magna TaxID=35525 RepID=A0ABR0AB65_9CRUS|nr:hypothetical protein OUZ56_007847 [Daphnia magna]